MTIHVGIFPSDREMLYYDDVEKRAYDLKINTVEYNERGKVSSMFEEIKSKIIGKKLGCLCICLYERYGNNIRKTFIEEGLKGGFKNVEIINNETTFYLNAMSQVNYKPLNGNVIWIEHDSYFYAWKITDGKAKFIGQKSTDSRDIIWKKESDIVLLINKGFLSTVFSERSPDCRFFLYYYSYSYSRASLLKARISSGDCFLAYLNVSNYYIPEITLRVKNRSFLFKRYDTLELSYSHPIAELWHGFPLIAWSIEFIKLPAYQNMCLSFDIDANGIYTVAIFEQAVEIDIMYPAQELVTFKFKANEKTKSPAISKIFDKTEVYRNFSSPKGLVLIINNRYENDAERFGTEHDEKNIRKLFLKLGYKVLETQQSLSAKSMFAAAKCFTRNKEHILYDSCVAVILTHGKHDHLSGNDGKYVNVHTFLQCFNSINAPLLKGKPKLFFIQACRGDEHCYGTDCPDSYDIQCFLSYSLITDENRSFPSFSSGNERILRSLSTSSLIQADTQPAEADMLIAYATIPKHVAIRYREKGSWFIQSVCDIFSQYAETDDILSLLTRVR